MINYFGNNKLFLKSLTMKSVSSKIFLVYYIIPKHKKKKQKDIFE